MDYPFADIAFHRYGIGNSQYWIFEPAKPTPKSAPVIIFLHGWSATNPNTYGAWIKHLVRRGNIVIYPRYQAYLSTPLDAYTPNAVAAMKSALLVLLNGDPVKPELDHVAIVGHSMGGAMAPNLAALAAKDGLPIPKAICCVEPGTHFRNSPTPAMPMEDLSKISAGTLTLVIVGDEDHVVGDETAKMIFGSLKQIPPEKKNYVTLMTDDHGSPALVAGHLAPIAMEILDQQTESEESPAREQIRLMIGANSVNSMDFYGTWKLFDGLTDDAFYGKNGEYALGKGPEIRYMGKWSDGIAVKELKVGE